MSSSRIIRRYERFLFNGVPEFPEPIWGANDNFYFSPRYTGLSQIPSTIAPEDTKSNDIGCFIYDFDYKTEEYVSYDFES